MKAQVLKTFLYSSDGISSVPMLPSDNSVDIRDDLAPGLIKEGYIVEITEEPSITDDDTHSVSGSPIRPSEDTSTFYKRKRK